MVDIFKSKAVINKKNKQINISLPRKELSKSIIEQLESGKQFKVKLEKFYT